MIRKALASLAFFLAFFANCGTSQEPLVEVTGDVQPGLCDPFDDNVGATPPNAVDIVDIWGLGFRFTPINLDTAWDFFSAFDHATAGSGTYVWICEQVNHVTVTKPCRHNANYSSNWESTGVPGPAWAPCWKQNTMSHFRRILPGQTATGISAPFQAGQQSLLVQWTYLPDPPACPAFVRSVQQNCGTTSDSGKPEIMLTNATGGRLSGLWPSGQTGAPCLTTDSFSGAPAIARYNCPVEPRDHYDY